MADVEIELRHGGILLPSGYSPQKGDRTKSYGSMVEQKIEYLESLAGRVSNRRSRRWLNDRLLLELVPRLNGEEIRGLFAPPPWGDKLPLSDFTMTNEKEWDAFRNVDMDAEASLLKAVAEFSTKRNDPSDEKKMSALSAWHRVDCRIREALKRSFLSHLVESFEECIREFVKDSGNDEVLIMHVQDPYHRLLLHGICEFYNLLSVSFTRSENAKQLRMTKITKKKSGCRQLPNMTLTDFLKAAKVGMTSS